MAAARAAWTRHLVDLGGRNTLLWYRDLPSGTLDLTTAHPGGVASMMAGRPTKLSDLVREPAALEDARRRARAVAAKSRELAEERGILTCFLAVGMATWAVRLPDGRTAPRSPAAPVLLRSCTLRPTGAAQGDFSLDLGPELEVNPVLVNYLRSEQGIYLDDGRPRGAHHARRDVRPLPGVLRAGRGVRGRARLLGVATAGRRHLLLRQAADGGRPRRPG